MWQSAQVLLLPKLSRVTADMKYLKYCCLQVESTLCIIIFELRQRNQPVWVKHGIWSVQLVQGVFEGSWGPPIITTVSDRMLSVSSSSRIFNLTWHISMHLKIIPRCFSVWQTILIINGLKQSIPVGILAILVTSGEARHVWRCWHEFWCYQIPAHLSGCSRLVGLSRALAVIDTDLSTEAALFESEYVHMEKCLRGWLAGSMTIYVHTYPFTFAKWPSCQESIKAVKHVYLLEKRCGQNCSGWATIQHQNQI